MYVVLAVFLWWCVTGVILISQVPFPPHPIPYPRALVYLLGGRLLPHLLITQLPCHATPSTTHPPTHLLNLFPPEDITLLRHVRPTLHKTLGHRTILAAADHPFRFTRSLHTFPSTDCTQHVYGSAYYSATTDPAPFLPVCTLPGRHATSVVSLLHRLGTGREPPLEGTQSVCGRWAG